MYQFAFTHNRELILQIHEKMSVKCMQPMVYGAPRMIILWSWKGIKRVQQVCCKIPQDQEKQILSPQFPFWSISRLCCFFWFCFFFSRYIRIDPLWQPCRRVCIASEMRFWSETPCTKYQSLLCFGLCECFMGVHKLDFSFRWNSTGNCIPATSGCSVH